MKRRLLGLAVGLCYAVGYGFLTMLMTGGGHGNFLWFMAFSLTFFLGLFFPAAGFLVVNLKPVWARAGLMTLLFLNLFSTVYFFWGFLTPELWEDMAKSWELSRIGFIVFSAFHCIPLIALWVIALRNINALDGESLD